MTSISLPLVTRRQLLAGAASALVLPAAAPLRAADYPSRPITVILPTVPGGALDAVARLVADRLAPRLKQPIVIESKGGGAGTLGLAQVARAPADGYTLTIAADSYLTVSPRLVRGATLQPLTDLAPVIELGSSPFVLVASPALGVNTFAEYIAKVRARPGQVTYASAGMGTPHHLAMALLEQRQSLRQTHVPYKGGPQALADVLGGHTDCMFIAMSTAEKHIASGKLVALAVSGEQRLPNHPSIPAITETVPGYQWAFWFAVFAPKGTPEPVVARLHRELAEILAARDVVDGLKTIGLQPAPNSTPQALRQKLQAEDALMGRLITSLNLQPE